MFIEFFLILRAPSWRMGGFLGGGVLTTPHMYTYTHKHKHTHMHAC